MNVGRIGATVTVAALACAGCGAGQKRTTNPTRSSALAQAEATHEYPSPPPPPETAHGTLAGAIPAIRAFATAYINWTAQSVAADMRALAASTVGQARSAMTLAAAETNGDYELQRGGLSNSGTVEAIAPLSGKRDQYVVVTLESTSAANTTAYDGLRPAWHVALATVTQQRDGTWVVSAWQPES
ncbi:MAG: hypothetical protein JO304_07450 [Solirubrobacterales bacterium]|nr:hypothetical protein [Solirubrobacterales bacterium]